MYHRVRRKMTLNICAILFLSYFLGLANSIDIKRDYSENDDDNDIVDFDDEYSIKYNKKLGLFPWHSSDYNKDSYKYALDKDATEEALKTDIKTKRNEYNDLSKLEMKRNLKAVPELEKTTEINLMPIELLSTTEYAEAESTTDDLTVIPLSTEKINAEITINQTVTLPASTEISEDYNLTTEFFELTTKAYTTTVTFNDTTESYFNVTSTESNKNVTNFSENTTKASISHTSTELNSNFTSVDENKTVLNNRTETTTVNTTDITSVVTTIETDKYENYTSTQETVNRGDFDSTESVEEVPIFTELDTEEISHIPEDYYDSKDVIPTSAPKTDALSVLFGFAGSVVESVVESVAERVVPKGIFDLFKRMQKQNEALEAEKLRSREENGGIGQFTRGVIKSISSGLSKPLSQLMAGVRDIGSLDSDRGFINSLASGVTSVANVANSMVDVFKDRVQAIYPGTVWCGDGKSAQARSSDLGLFFFTDTCCRQHDACKMYIQAGETKFGLTNTGLFTRSHCSCDTKFRECLQKTNSLVSAQIGLTYFNVLGPQCFRRAHPIVRCIRRTRITGLKCEEYELDLTKPKMWQWFDNETF